MALEEGLIVPAIMSIENMSLSEISQSVKDLRIGLEVLMVI